MCCLPETSSDPAEGEEQTWRTGMGNERSEGRKKVILCGFVWESVCNCVCKTTGLGPAVLIVLQEWVWNKKHTDWMMWFNRLLNFLIRGSFKNWTESLTFGNTPKTWCNSPRLPSAARAECLESWPGCWREGLRVMAPPIAESALEP